MEILSFNSKEQDIADAIYGKWGKEVYDDCSIVYCGQIVFAIGKKENIEKRMKSTHYDWQTIGDNVFLAVLY